MRLTDGKDQHDQCQGQQKKRKIITHLTRLFFGRLHCSAEHFSSSYHSTPSSNSE
jgi:hypothetical protein